MDIRTLFEDNIYEYSAHVDDDVAENMGRLNFQKNGTNRQSPATSRQTAKSHAIF